MAFVRFILMGILFFASATNVNAQATLKKKPVAKTTVTKNRIVKLTVAPAKTFANNIQLFVKGFEVQDAYLYFNDGTKVPEGNIIGIRQDVNLRIILAKGFQEINGKVFPGGSEKLIFSSSGDVILESKDLYTAYDSVGVSPVDARYITLKAVVNTIKDNANEVTISFKIWDKKTALNEITGSYIIHIK